jgi:exopolysaccharide biosynthesis polyprenyl glycosylphosphotransferase
VVRLFNHWLSPRKAVFFLAEETAMVLALLAGASVSPLARTPTGLVRHDLGAAFLRAAPAAVVFAGALYLGDLYDLRAAVRDRADGRCLLRALGAAMVVLAFAYLVLPALLPVGWLSRRSLFFAAAGGALAVIAVRAVMPAVLGAPVRVLFLGSGARARQLAQDVEAQADSLFETVGFVAVGNERVAALAASGETTSVPSAGPAALRGPVEVLARQLRAQAVVVAVDDRRSALPVDGLLACRTRGLPVMSDVAFAEATLKRIPLHLVRPSALIFDTGFQVSAMTRVVKRALDVTVSAALLVALAPVLLAVAAAIAVSDGRPVFFLQERTGLSGASYRVWKLRTMRRDAEATGAAWASDRDPRVLPIGRFLRRSRLDELPQLWNVIRGEMSLVGPRPERPVFLAELKARYPLFTLRELVKPGLTGWAQLKYGYVSTMEEQARKLEYDLYYIKNMSLFLDLVCLFHTAKIILSGRGAR